MRVPLFGAYQLMLARPLSVLLLCLLLLALPAQGVLAVVMQSSMLESSLQQSQQPPQFAEHGPCVEKSSAVEAAPAHFLSDHKSCNLCLFCVGALASGPELLLSPLPASALPSVARLQPFVGYIADTPERPPRHLLA